MMRKTLRGMDVKSHYGSHKNNIIKGAIKI